MCAKEGPSVTLCMHGRGYKDKKDQGCEQVTRLRGLDFTIRNKQ